MLLTWNPSAFFTYCVFRSLRNEETEIFYKHSVYVACIHLSTFWYDASSCSESGREVVAYSSLVKLNCRLVLFLMALDFVAGCLGGLIDHVARMYVWIVNSPQGI